MRYLQNIFIFYAFTQYIFGAHAACPEACADYSTRKEFTPQKQKARDPFVSRLALKEFRVSFSLYAPENGPPAAVHAAHSSSFWALGSCLRAYSRRRAARLSAIVSTVLGLGLAYMGFGVWALVVQQVSNITVDTLVLWKLSSWRPKMEFSWQHLKGLLSYGWKLLASSLSSVIYNNLRSLIIGKMYTSADLAYYNQGDNLTYNIAASVDTSIESVLFPVMSSLQDDRAQVKNMTRRSIKTCTYIIAPVMMSTAFCAEPLVRLILTEKWLPCVLFLRVFCLGYVCWPIITANLNA